MRNLIRCNRGAAAFAAVIALVPLIGVVALGGEAGSWYVTRQHAQNAADAAAMAGGLYVACTISASSSCTDTQGYDYRGKEFAAQNAFCNAGASYPNSNCPSLGTGVSQSVAMDRGTWAGGWTSSASGNDVKATVSQTQPAYLAAILGLTTVTIPAQAIAHVEQTKNPCVLSLTDPVNFGGSTNVSAGNCGIQSDNSSSGSFTFTGNGNTVTAGPGALSGVGGCTENTGTPCDSVNKYAQTDADPLSGLNSAMQSLTTSTTNFANGACGTAPTTYSSGHCYNTSLPSSTLNGVYFFNGPITISGSSTITGTATLIFLKGSSLTINGNPTITISAPSSVSSTRVPTALSSVTSLMSSLLIYDPEGASWSTNGCPSPHGVKLSGSSTSYFSGITYVPNCDVTFTGNNTSSSPGSTCTELIAKGVTFTGSSYFDNSGCPASVQVKSVVVALVQ